MKRKLSSAAALMVAAGAMLVVPAAPALASPAASAQAKTSDGIAEYREMLGEGGNPAELIEMTGEELWAEKRGPKMASLEQCDLGKGPGVVKDAYAQMPRYFDDAKRVMDLESRLVHCMVTLQGMDAKDVTKKPFSGGGDYASDLEALVGYVVGQSRGTPLNVPQEHPQEKAAFERGKQIFFTRGGPYDFSCASCHSVDGQRIRLQDLPNLTSSGPAKAAYTSWPAYRVSQGALRSMQWRLNDCFRQQRMPHLKYGSQASIDLTVFLAVNANGGEMAAPGLKR
jgi:L-cysteine S-thiosulfotransferase